MFRSLRSPFVLFASAVLALAGVAQAQSQIVTWGDNFYSQCNVPALPSGLAYVAVAAGRAHSVARSEPGNPATIVCAPAQVNVLACPCSNPPGGPGRGCDNKAATGGASISGTGLNSLSNPTLLFTTAGENATAFSIMIQGSTLTTGVAFGHGVRCMTSFKRMYRKNAIGGSLTLPDLPGGDSAIPIRSAAAGDTILAGEKRFYQVYYRDTTLLLGGCPLVASEFNITSGAEVTWLP